MISANLNSGPGLFPDGVRELQLRCLDKDVFCWVITRDSARERLVALPDGRSAAQLELSETLARDHGFTSEQAAQAAQTLFEAAFRGVPEARPLVGELLARPRIEASQQRAQASAINW
jgi:hypothetical protein